MSSASRRISNNQSVTQRYTSLSIACMLKQFKKNNTYTKANKLLGFIRHNTRFVKSTLVRHSAYLAILRPHLGYATQVWSPQSIELIHKVERI